MIKKMKFLAVAFFLMLATVMQAQVTTSSMSGRVTDSDGAVIGATVVATHVPSGTTYGTVTNIDGRYNLNGMRVGGPYNVEVSYIGYGKNVTEDVTLSLGETYVLNVEMKEETVALGEVVVTAFRNPILNSDRTGASMNVSSRELRSLPTVNRSISDFTRMTPQAMGNSFAGRDGRFNTVTIDGAAFNNNFGLSSSAMPGGSAQPISLDALEEVSVNIAPYDVRMSQFTGASIAAVTKSGTNQFTGSVYTYQRPTSFTGNLVGDQVMTNVNSRSSSLYGFTAGGAIIKNKLFFFVSGEYEKEVIPTNSWEPSDDGVANSEKYISRTTKSDLKTMKDHLMNTYSYDPGDYMNFKAFPSENYKMLAKLDWNINEQHKFSVRYNMLRNKSMSLTNPTSGPPNVPRGNTGRISDKSIAFSNSFYGNENNINAVSAELNSIFNPKLTNRFLVSYTATQDPKRTSSSAPFPFVEIYKDGDRYMAFGYELFSWNNQVLNNTFSISNNITYSLNNHVLTGGIAYDNIYVNNSYIREGTSFYRYNSMEDFMTNQKPAAFGITYGYDGQPIKGVEMSFGLGSIYLQDQWALTPQFKLTYGARLEMPMYHNKLVNNPAIDALPEMNGYKMHVGTWPNTQIMINPRLGFNWDVKGDRSIQLRGGTGLFTGLLPFVWFTNQPTASGTVQSPELGIMGASLPNDFRFNPDWNAQVAKYPTLFPSTMSATLPMGSTLAEVSKDFKMPQVWRNNIAADIKLPWTSVLTLEVLYSKDVNAVLQQNVNLLDAQTTFAGADNRPRWTTKQAKDENGNLRFNNNGTPMMVPDNVINERLGNVMILDNINKGYQFSFTTQLTKNFSNGLSGMIAYTYNLSKDVTSNPGSNAASAWTSNLEVGNLNNPMLSYSNFAIPHRLVGSVSYRIADHKNLATTFSLFYTGSHQGRASYAYPNDMNGDGATSDLMYIPKDASELVFITKSGMTPQQQSDAFMKYVDSDKYLSAHKGEYAQRFGVLEPWMNRFDFKVLKDIYVTSDKRYGFQVSLDIINVGNLLNSKWGVYKRHGLSNQYSVYQPLRYEGVTTDGKPQFSLNAANVETFEKNAEYLDNLTSGSTWGMLLGLRFNF